MTTLFAFTLALVLASPALYAVYRAYTGNN